MLRSNRPSNPQTAPSECMLRLTVVQTAMSSCFLLFYSPLAAQSSHACLHLPGAGIKDMWFQVLGSPLCELCFSFRLDRFCVAQGSLEFTEIHQPLWLVLGLKVCATIAWPLVSCLCTLIFWQALFVKTQTKYHYSSYLLRKWIGIKM